MIELKYSFEYFCSPIWVKDAEQVGSIFENISAHALPLSKCLQAEIDSLNAVYQSTYNEEYPPEPKRLNMKEEVLFCKKVITSAKHLYDELPRNYKVIFDKVTWENRITEINKG